MAAMATDRRSDKRALQALMGLLALALLLPLATLAQADAGAPVTLRVQGSPLISRSGDRLEVEVTLAEPADLRLRVTDYDGRSVRELYAGQRQAGALTRVWLGRSTEGVPVPAGPYRIEATATPATPGSAAARAETWVTVADRAVYPRAPGFITVAVDPGHGGSLSGAVGKDGTREADINLDIGLRLARMLEGAGVNVAITRTTDAFVNEPPRERTGNGIVDDDDELAARPDVANLARADLFISIHNNNAVNESVGGPSTYYFDERPFGARSARLARVVQDEMVNALRGISDGYQPYDHGTLVYPYYVLRGYDPPRLRRPTQMPGVLSEGMFLSNERELRYLKRPAVRARMAAAYYDAIAKYLARRSTHVGYRLIEQPAGPVTASTTATYAIEVRNQGNAPLREWRLEAAAFPAPSHYVGRIRRGSVAGEALIPRLEPGEAASVEVDIAAPGPGGEWMLVFDARERGGRRAATGGSPALQVPPPDARPALGLAIAVARLT